MTIRINNIKLTIDEDSEENLLAAIGTKFKINSQAIKSWRIAKKSLDARRKDNIVFVYSVDIELQGDENRFIQKSRVKGNQLSILKPTEKFEIPADYSIKALKTPIVVGAGPAGLFAALILAEAGLKPIILEKGQDIRTRSEDIENFWSTGQFKPLSNVQFGEGGAGTFSDGKLTTRISDSRIEKVLETFVEAGAPEEILYINKPHIGTDKLRTVIVNLRNHLIDMGAKIRFGAEVTKILIEKGQVVGVEVNKDEIINAKQVIFAPGHSSRNTYRMLKDEGFDLQAKAFAMGVRIEHPQALIDTAQYGELAGHPKLGASDYHLTYNNHEMGRSAYTFCMCPGGQVVAAASDYNTVVTNGMSEHARDSGVANAALVVSVGPDDYKSKDVLAGVEFQEYWEQQAFNLGGQNYHAPAQRVEDFLAARPTKDFNSFGASYRPGVVGADLHKTLPDYCSKMLELAIVDMDKRLQNFAHNDAVLTGIETRTSAPVRILRDESKQAVGIVGFYPAGEGAGYAGGIMSAAVDGIKVAEALIKNLVI